jgi:hypothetical protein
MMRHPAFANKRAEASPMPEVAPVIKAVLVIWSPSMECINMQRLDDTGVQT